MDPDQFRTLSELAMAEDDRGWNETSKQTHHIHALAYEDEDDDGCTLRSAYSVAREEDGSSVYFSLNGSRASSAMMDGGSICPVVKNGDMSGLRETMSDCLDDCSVEMNEICVDKQGAQFEDGEEKEKGEEQRSGCGRDNEGWHTVGKGLITDVNIQKEMEQDLVCALKRSFTVDQEKDTTLLDENKAGSSDHVPKIPLGIAPEERPESRQEDVQEDDVEDAGRVNIVEPHIVDISNDFPREEDRHEGPARDTAWKKDRGAAVLRERLLSEAESIVPVMSSGSAWDEVRRHESLTLPTPIHEEGKSNGAEVQDATPVTCSLNTGECGIAPCQSCQEMSESMSTLQDELSNAQATIARYEKQIVDIQTELSNMATFRGDDMEQLQEEIRYLKVLHTEEMSQLVAENGMLRQQLMDPYRVHDDAIFHSVETMHQPHAHVQSSDRNMRRPKLIIPEDSQHSLSCDQIGYSPLGAARIQFK